jgi:hypothetical protein
MNRLGHTMSNYRPIGLIAVAVVLGCGVTAQAQPRGRFDRVTAAAQGDGRSASNGNRAASAGRAAAAAKATARANSLSPYSTQNAARGQAMASQPPDSSTWQLEPRRTASPRPAGGTPQPHTYYPGLKSGRAFQQPVKLSARRGAMMPPAIIGPSRKKMPTSAPAGRRR